MPQSGDSIDIGDNVVTNCDFCLVPGTRQVAAKSIQDRVVSDTNATALSYKDYVQGGGGNSRRLVVVPVVTGVCGSYGSQHYDANCPSNPVLRAGLRREHRNRLRVVLPVAREQLPEQRQLAPVCRIRWTLGSQLDGRRSGQRRRQHWRERSDARRLGRRLWHCLLHIETDPPGVAA